MLSINHLANCHDDRNIIFCKTDFILSELDKISLYNQNITLITGNSDYPITDQIMKHCPDNVEKWYAANALTNHYKIIPIPIGIENQFECKRIGHGIAFTDRYNTKKKIIESFVSNNIYPTKLIYANFNINTNMSHRNIVKQHINKTTYITWSEPNLSYYNLYQDIFNHKMVLCPMGNGIDTHRLWETLYCDRVPIVIKMGDFKIYELYKQLPIIILKNVSDLLDINLIMDKYQLIQQIKHNTNLLCINYWIEKIKNVNH